MECQAGGVIHFVSGDMLWLTGLPLRALRNEGTGAGRARGGVAAH